MKANLIKNICLIKMICRYRRVYHKNEKKGSLTSLKVGRYMMESGKDTLETGMVFKVGQMVRNTKESGKITRLMEKESFIM